MSSTPLLETLQRRLAESQAYKEYQRVRKQREAVLSEANNLPASVWVTTSTFPISMLVAEQVGRPVHPLLPKDAATCVPIARFLAVQEDPDNPANVLFTVVLADQIQHRYQALATFEPPKTLLEAEFLMGEVGVATFTYLPAETPVRRKDIDPLPDTYLGGGCGLSLLDHNSRKQVSRWYPLLMVGCWPR